MSARVSTALPRACSGDMYAGVPRIIPACVLAGAAIVGDCETFGDVVPVGCPCLRQPEVQNLHHAVGPQLDVGGFQVTVNHSLLVRRFERLRDLFRDGQRFVERDRAAGDPLREILALDQLHDEGAQQNSSRP